MKMHRGLLVCPNMYRSTAKPTSTAPATQPFQPLPTSGTVFPFGGGASKSALFARATYSSFEDMLEKEPGPLLVDFFAT